MAGGTPGSVLISECDLFLSLQWGGALPAGLPVESRLVMQVMAPSAPTCFSCQFCDAQVTAPRRALYHKAACLALLLF